MPAHEAGHLIGRPFNGGKDFPHSGGKFDLMKDGGSPVAKIPFDQAIKSFNPP
jgi:hypothetical protein